MTSTQTSQQRRAEWLDGLIEAVDPEGSEFYFRAVAYLLIYEGPAYARETNAWWGRKLTYLRRRLLEGDVPMRKVVCETLRDLRDLNLHNGR